MIDVVNNRQANRTRNEPGRNTSPAGENSKTWERRDKAAARARMSFLDIWVFAKDCKLLPVNSLFNRKIQFITQMDNCNGVRIAQKSLFFYRGIASEDVLCSIHLYDIL
jgi:hypothetical protein